MINEYHYQDVSERWVDKIPSHWEMLRLKRILQIRKEKNNPVVTDFILSLTASQGVVPVAEKEGAGGNKPKDDLTKYSVARKNDLLVNCMNVVAGSAGVSKWDGAISPVYYALYPRDEDSCNIWYFHYLFRLLPFQRSLLGLGKGILLHESSTGKLNTVRMRISMDYLNNVNLPLPPRDEQDKIVAYLNWKTSMINRMISAKKREIKLLKEYKESAISYYVTHGLTKTEMRPTEIYWLREVPKGWSETKLKYLLKKHKREVPENAELLICSNSGDVKKRGDSKLGLVASSDDIYQGVQSGDLLIHGMDTWHGAIAISDYDGMCTPVVHVCTCNQSKRFVALIHFFAVFSRFLSVPSTASASFMPISAIPAAYSTILQKSRASYSLPVIDVIVSPLLKAFRTSNGSKALCTVVLQPSLSVIYRHGSYGWQVSANLSPFAIRYGRPFC